MSQAAEKDVIKSVIKLKTKTEVEKPSDKKPPFTETKKDEKK